MPDIYTYYDYHRYLQDFYEQKKSEASFFSYRYISGKVGIDHALVVKIFQGKRDLSGKSLAAFTRLLGLSPRKAEYFELLVLYGKAKSDREIKHYFEKMLSFSGIGGRQVQADQYEFYRKWYHTAIRELIHITRFKSDYAALGRLLNPSISPAQACKSVQLLERLGFIKKNKDKVYEITDAFIFTGENWKGAAVRAFQKETMDLAIRALEEIPKDERDISTVTITLNDEGLEQARERVRQMQKDLFAISSACDKVDKVYQANMQLFPLSDRVAKEAKS